MEMRGVVWLGLGGLLGGALGLAAIGLGSRGLLTPRSDGAVPVMASPRRAGPGRALAHDAQTPAGYWRDPSVDPKLLERAFAPPPHVPPEARPKPPAIMPSEREWHRLQRDDSAVAY